MSDFYPDAFLRACGADGPLHLAVGHGGGVSTYAVPWPFAVAGTDPRADVWLADPSLPARAAYLQLLGGRLLCLDLMQDDDAARKGSYPPHRWLDPDQAWSCGPVAIRFLPVGAGAGRPVQLANPTPVVLHFTDEGPGGAGEFHLKVPFILLGTARQCQIRLRSRTVSRFHCALIRTPAGLWAVDLLGRGGITVNGTVARAARVDEGDELRIGKFVLRARFPEPDA
ncbi:MAG TPA: FHA domain-containing protein [Gemmataceae bacterium]|jgi:hypothetical protein